VNVEGGKIEVEKVRRWAAFGRWRLEVRGEKLSAKIEGVLDLHTFPPSQFLTFFPLGGRRSAIFWRVKGERIILNFYCLILNSKFTTKSTRSDSTIITI